MKLNYKGLMQEINEEVKEGVITQNDTIQVLRDDTPIFQEYCPIIDWYYDAFTMKEELETPMEEMYLPEEFSKEEWASMVKEQAEYKAQYQSDQPKLTSMKVKDVLTEMKQMQKLFS